MEDHYRRESAEGGNSGTLLAGIDRFDSARPRRPRRSHEAGFFRIASRSRHNRRKRHPRIVRRFGRKSFQGTPKGRRSVRTLARRRLLARRVQKNSEDSSRRIRKRTVVDRIRAGRFRCYASRIENRLCRHAGRHGCDQRYQAGGGTKEIDRKLDLASGIRFPARTHVYSRFMWRRSSRNREFDNTSIEHLPLRESGAMIAVEFTGSFKSAPGLAPFLAQASTRSTFRCRSRMETRQISQKEKERAPPPAFKPSAIIAFRADEAREILENRLKPHHAPLRRRTAESHGDATRNGRSLNPSILREFFTRSPASCTRPYRFPLAGR